MRLAGIISAMSESNLTDDIERQQKYLDELKKYRPQLFEKPMSDPSRVARKIGINQTEEMPRGYIRLFATDFIVEEVRSSREVVSLDPGELIGETLDSEGQTYYCDLVKVNTTTHDAITQLAQGLNLPVTAFGYAGIKDKTALTSQKISIRKTTADDLEKVNLPNLLLKNCRLGKGAIANGDLVGNRFTIMVRAEKPVDEAQINSQIDLIKSRGVLNYYGLQRFGPPRILSSALGEYILRRQYEKTIKTFLVSTSDFELPAYTQIREDAKSVYGQWQKMLELFEKLPFTFRHEIAILRHLNSKNNDFLGALRATGDQPKMWVYAYNSYLFNLLLSSLNQLGDKLPEDLPAAVSKTAIEQNVYAKLDLQIPPGNDYELRLLGISENTSKTPTRIYPEFTVPAKLTAEGLILSFILPKGAYATTMLSNLFTIYEAHPIPEWVKKTEYDLKKELGQGDLTGIKARLTFGQSDHGFRSPPHP